MFRHLVPLLSLIATASVAAEDAAPPAVAQPEDGFSTSGKIGAFGSSVVTSNADSSRDPSISGTTETVAYRLSLEAGVEYRNGKHSVEHDLLAKYGRKKDQNTDWVEDTDEVRYDGVYRYAFSKPHYAFASWGWESVFTGPEPEADPFQPGLVKGAAGYGQLYENFWAKSSKLDARIGVGARKRYGRILSARDTEVETGIELFVRHERILDERLRYFLQYEAFSEFADLAHITNLVTAGLTLQLYAHLTVELGLRAFYETEPEDAVSGSSGYDELGLRQDTLVGLTYTW